MNMYDSIARQDADLPPAVGRLCAQHVCGRHSAVLLSGCRSAAGSCCGTWSMAGAWSDGASKLSAQVWVLLRPTHGSGEMRWFLRQFAVDSFIARKHLVYPFAKMSECGKYLVAVGLPCR